MSFPNEKSASIDTIEIKQQEDLYEEGSIDPVYQAKAHVLNRAIQETGMGRYQVCLSKRRSTRIGTHFSISGICLS